MKKTLKFFIKNLPDIYLINYLISMLYFIYYHKRIPLKKNLLNDYLFYFKIGSGIEKDLYRLTTDKISSKNYIINKLGNNKRVIKNISILRTTKEILSYTFNKNTIVKPNHLSGNIIYIDSENSVDRSMLCSWLSKNYFKLSREKNYKKIEPAIMIEPMFFDGQSYDFKIHCYKSKPKIIQVDFNRRNQHTRCFFDINFNNLKSSTLYPISNLELKKPYILQEMIDISCKLSSDFNLVRIDFLVSKDLSDFMIGEITHCHGGANEKFIPKDAENLISNIIFD